MQAKQHDTRGHSRYNYQSAQVGIELPAEYKLHTAAHCSSTEVTQCNGDACQYSAQNNSKIS